jgi:hypothetical protein
MPWLLLAVQVADLLDVISPGVSSNRAVLLAALLMPCLLLAVQVADLLDAVPMPNSAAMAAGAEAEGGGTEGTRYLLSRSTISVSPLHAAVVEELDVSAAR